MLDRHGILLDIAQIGSIDWQRRWFVNGTLEEGWADLYEFIETRIHEARRQATYPGTRSKFSASEQEALIRFHDRVDAIYGLIPWRDSNLTKADIVEHDENMRRIRDAANACLNSLGIVFTMDEIMNY